jgi:hypothetical protein
LKGGEFAMELEVALRRAVCRNARNLPRNTQLNTFTGSRKRLRAEIHSV